MLEKISLLFFKIIHGRKFKLYKGNILKPLKIQGAQYMQIEQAVFVHNNTWLGAYKINNIEPELILGRGTCLGHFNQISCVGKIVLGKNVLTADNVFITDNTHEFNSIDIPIMHQSVKSLNGKDLTIGDGSWIGRNVCVIGSSIGKNCIIGANSVVTKDVEDYTMVAGIPAKVLKRFNHDSKTWEFVKE